MPQTLQCYKCGAQNVLGVRFCTVCGERFVYKCPQCSTTIDPGSEYCSHCAAKLDWGIGATQQTDISPQGIKPPTKVEQETPNDYNAKQKERPQRRGMSPWFIALIIIVLLIIVVFVIERVVQF